MSLASLSRRDPDLAAPAFAPGAASDAWRQRTLIHRYFVGDRRVAAVLLAWYAALLLGWQPGIPGALSMIVFWPLWVVLSLIGFLMLPGNLLIDLGLELAEPLASLYAWGFLAFVAGLHAWLYFRWRWPVLALIALLLCGSSFGCYANLGW